MRRTPRLAKSRVNRVPVFIELPDRLTRQIRMDTLCYMPGVGRILVNSGGRKNVAQRKGIPRNPG